jgi:N utilization substance protein B
MAQGGRRKARVLALQALYEVDISGHRPAAALDAILAEEPQPPDAVAYARELIEGVTAARDRIDGIISATAPSWPVEQISAVDRNILRLAILEIVVNNQVPVRAAINEAVELAKLFGSDNSARFINGVLGSVSSGSSRSG